MPQLKKWYEYSRPIPFDEHHRRIQQDCIYRENKHRRKWEDTYGKIVHLYRDDASISEDKHCCGDEVHTSLLVGAPTSERVKFEPVLEPYSEVKCKGVVEPVQPMECKAAVEPETYGQHVFIQKDDGDGFCNCSPQSHSFHTPSECKNCCRDEGNASPGGSKDERIKVEAILEPYSQVKCEGTVEPVQPTECKAVVKPECDQQVSTQNRVRASLCNCSPRFRTLKFPPKCNHVCARMGFDCWMCHVK